MAEALKIPKEVINSDWKDDIDYEPFGTNKQEMEYIAPNEVSKESIDKIKSRKLNQKRGNIVISLFTKNEKLTA